MKFYVQVHTKEPIVFAVICKNEDAATAIAKAIAAAYPREDPQWDVEADDREMQTDPENIHGLPSMRQSVEEDRAKRGR